MIIVLKTSTRYLTEENHVIYQEIITTGSSTSDLIKLFEKSWKVPIYLKSGHKKNLSSFGKEWMPHSKTIVIKFSPHSNHSVLTVGEGYRILIKEGPPLKDELNHNDGVIYSHMNNIYIRVKVRKIPFYELEHQFLYRLLKVCKFRNREVVLLGDIIIITNILTNLFKKSYNQRISM
jgi:hypothetical protein